MVLTLFPVKNGPMVHAWDRGVQMELEPLETEAARLFVERGMAVAPEFRPTEHGGAVVDVCRQLDGIQLAIELAAARVKVLTPDARYPWLAAAVPADDGVTSRRIALNELTAAGTS